MSTTPCVSSNAPAAVQEQFVPCGFNRAMVYLQFADAPKAIEWYKTVFGATERMRVETADKKYVMHAQLQLGDTVIMLGDMPCPANIQRGSPTATLYTYVPDVDAAYAAALKHGSTGIVSPHDAFYGDRMACFGDPFGNHWTVARQIMNKTPEEIKSAIEIQAKAAAASPTSSEEKEESSCCANVAAAAKASAKAVLENGSSKDLESELARWPKMNHVHHSKSADRKAPKIVSESEWIAAMKQHIVAEKTLTHQKDYVTSLRQQLPWMEVRSDYVFEDLHGKKLNFLDLFSNPNHDDLILQTIMLPAQYGSNDCCPMCASWADNVNGNLFVMQQKTNIAIVAKGSPQLISDFAKKRGWNANLPLISAHENTYLEDVGQSLTPAQYDEFKQLIDECNGDAKAALEKLKKVNPNHPNVRVCFGVGIPFLMPNFGGKAVFHLDRKSKKLYKTFFYQSRGAESLNAAFGYFDLLPYGREDFQPTL